MKIALALIVIHFIGDFLCQNDKMAIGKSKSLYWLTIHVSVYALILSIGSYFLFDNIGKAIIFVSFNFALHWWTDFFTSKLTSWLYVKGDQNPTQSVLMFSWRHWFFSAIGFDQVIHYACLFYTYNYFNGI